MKEKKDNNSFIDFINKEIRNQLSNDIEKLLWQGNSLPEGWTIPEMPNPTEIKVYDEPKVKLEPIIKRFFVTEESGCIGDIVVNHYFFDTIEETYFSEDGYFTLIDFKTNQTGDFYDREELTKHIEELLNKENNV